MAYSVIMMLPHEGLSKTIGHMESRWWVYGKKKKRRVPSPYDGTGYTPIYQSADAKKERIPTAGFLQQRYPLYEVLLCLIVGVLPSLRRPALLLSSVLGQKTEPTPQNPHF